MTGLLVANLTAEDQLAGHTLSKLARRRASALATLLRVFCRDGDLLYLPGQLDPEHLVPLPSWLGFGKTAFRWGGLPRKHSGEVTAWFANEDTSRIQARPPSSPSTLASHRMGDAHLSELFWAPVATCPKAARLVNDKRYLLQLSSACGQTLLTSSELVNSVKRLECLAKAHSNWVLKPPWGAAGRHRYRGNSPRDVLAPAVAAMFARHGELLFQPWVERTADWGASGFVCPHHTAYLGAHRQHIDADGRFHGVTFDDQLEPNIDATLNQTVHAVGAALVGIGYHGLFGIDAFHYRAADSHSAFCTLGELNARCTFGIVARLIAHRARKAHPGSTRIALRFGDVLPPQIGSHIVPLIRPTEKTPVAAWLEL